MIQQRCYRWTLSCGLFIQKTPRAVFAHHELLNQAQTGVSSTAAETLPDLSPVITEASRCLPAAFCQTSGFHCWRTSHLRAEPARLCGSRTCQSKSQQTEQHTKKMFQVAPKVALKISEIKNHN